MPAWADLVGIGFNPKQKIGTDENPFERHANSVLEVSRDRPFL